MQPLGAGEMTVAGGAKLQVASAGAAIMIRPSRMTILNVAGYQFVQIDDLPALKQRFEDEGRRLGLKGTILLAGEGINLFLAADADSVNAFLRFLRGDCRFADFAVKESWSQEAPFRRLRVRLKKEIITMRHPAIRPDAGRAPAVSPLTLKQWLDRGCDDEGRAVTLLDTRNRYEIEQGTFRGAIDPRIRHFSQFPDVVRSLADDLRQRTVVTFCTGGIRCEKAAIFMQQEGFERVFQLDGGILKYFEEVGGDHYSGKCFVFDDRMSLDPELRAESPGGTFREGPYEGLAVKPAPVPPPAPRPVPGSDPVRAGG